MGSAIDPSQPGDGQPASGPARLPLEEVREAAEVGPEPGQLGQVHVAVGVDALGDDRDPVGHRHQRH